MLNKIGYAAIFISILIIIGLLTKHESQVAVREEYDLLYNRLARDEMKGHDLIAVNAKHSYPMANAWIASSAAKMYINTNNKNYLMYSLRETEWLITNSDLDNDGILGWGLPVEIPTSWGSYPKDHEYQITSLFCIIGLLDTYDVLKDSLHIQKEKILQTSRKVIEGIIGQNCLTIHDDDTVSIWYSCSEEDETYDATNVNAMMVGVLSRLSKLKMFENTEYNEVSNKIAQRLLKNKIVRGDAWLWFYRNDSEYKKYIQDLVHSGFTAHGLLMYRENQEGAVFIDKDKVLKAFKLYRDNGNNNYKRFIDEIFEPRVWDVAFNLFILANYGDLISTENLDNEFQKLIKYKDSNGYYSFEHNDIRVFIRAQAAVLLSLSAYYQYLSYRPWYMFLYDYIHLTSSHAGNATIY